MQANRDLKDLLSYEFSNMTFMDQLMYKLNKHDKEMKGRLAHVTRRSRKYKHLHGHSILLRKPEIFTALISLCLSHKHKYAQANLNVYILELKLYYQFSNPFIFIQSSMI